MRTTSRSNPWLGSFFAIAVGISATRLFAQTNPCALDGPHDPANWSRIPQAARADTLPPEARKAQDDYFSRDYPVNVPYSNPDEVRGSWTSQTASSHAPYFPDRYWVVGTILDYDVHEVPGKTIYTVLHIRVDRLADNHQDKPNEPLVGSIVDAGTGGGCLVTRTGEIHGRITEPGTARTQPGHRYLLELVRTELNNLYEVGASIDLTSGKAEPLSAPDVKAVKAGTWTYLGLDEDAVIKRHKQENPNN